MFCPTVDPCQRIYSTVGNSESYLDYVAIACYDFNADNRSDIITVEFALSKTKIFLNNGDGTFTLKNVANFDPFSPVSLLAVDVDRDGSGDVIKLDNMHYGLSVLLNNGSNHHPKLQLYSTLIDPSSLTDSDMNSDGYPDVIVGCGPEGGLSIHYNDGHGSFRNRTFHENVCASSSAKQLISIVILLSVSS